MAEREPVMPRRRIPVPAVQPAAVDALAQPVVDRFAPGRAGMPRDARCGEPATQGVRRGAGGCARPGARRAARRHGRPVRASFVGPAGKLLDRALAELGIDRARLYLTNAVKHFRFERRGKLRLHRNPSLRTQACRSWLAAEIERVRPQTIVCLGATAALAVFGAGYRLMERRGAWGAPARRHLGDGDGASGLDPAAAARTLQEEAYRHWLDDLRGLDEVLQTQSRDA